MGNWNSFPILSEIDFQCLKGIARGAKKLIIMLVILVMKLEIII